MKIALIAEHTNPLSAHKGEPTCGESVHISAISRHLAKRGHRVTVFSRRNAPDLPDRSRMGRGVNVEHIAAGPESAVTADRAADHTGAFATALKDRLVDSGPDVVHAFGWTSGLAALSAARDTRENGSAPPIVQTFHSLNVAEQRAGLPKYPDRARMEAAIAGRADAIVVNSADQRFELARMGVPRGRVSVVPFGVDTDHFSVEGSTTAEPWHSRRGERTRIISVTGLASGSGADVLIEALTRLPDAELAIVADPAPVELALDEDAGRLKFLAKEAGVDDRVTLTGPIDRKELPKLLRSADVYVSAAPYDPYGGAVLEAMACGLPIIGKASGSIPGAVLHGTTGVLLRSVGPNTIARALHGLTSSGSTMRAAYGIAGADRAESRFTWQRVAAETERVYAHACPQEDALPLAAGDDAH